MSKLIFEGGSKTQSLRVVLDEYRGTRNISVRNWFLDKKDDEWKPTKKGITLGPARFHAVMASLISNFDEIDAWMESGSLLDQINGQNRREVAARLSARETSVPSSEVETDTRSPYFFSYEEFGGERVVVFNDSHPIVSELLALVPDEPGRGRLLSVLSLLGLAFHDARTNTESDSRESHLLDRFEAEFHTGLARIAKSFLGDGYDLESVGNGRVITRARADQPVTL